MNCLTFASFIFAYLYYQARPEIYKRGGYMYLVDGTAVTLLDYHIVLFTDTCTYAYNEKAR